MDIVKYCLYKELVRMVPGCRALKLDLTWLDKGTLACRMHLVSNFFFIALVAQRCESLLVILDKELNRCKNTVSSSHLRGRTRHRLDLIFAEHIETNLTAVCQLVVTRKGN